MRTRLKIFANVTGLLALALLLLYGVAAILVRPQLADLERANVQQNAARAKDAVDSDVKRLSTSTLDWSSWDATYDFAQNHNQAYLDENMTSDALQNLETDYVVLVDAKGKVIFSKGVDDDDGSDLVVPDDLIAAFAKSGPFQAVTDQSAHHGLLQLKSGPVAFASAPILNSLSEGPVHGTFVFAQHIDKDQLGRFADQTKLPIQLYSLSATDLPADVTAAKDGLSDKKITTRQISSDQDAGYQLLLDAAGHPAIIMRVEVSRTLSAQAGRSLDLYLIASGIIALLLSIINGRTVSRVIKKQETIDLKDEFFSVASHELRTPLTAIRGNSQLAKQMYGEGNADLTEMMDDIHNASVRLIRIVNNFLDAARLEQGRIPFKLETLNITDVISDVVDELQGLAAEKSLTIQAKLPDSLPLAYADKDRLKQVISNLIGNAVKFTDKGSIAISAKSEAGQIVVSAKDTGRGMTAEAQKTLFSRFTQTKHSDITSGSGLGLYISKLMVEAMKGTIWVESSVVGKGTTVSFSVPEAK